MIYDWRKQKRFDYSGRLPDTKLIIADDSVNIKKTVMLWETFRMLIIVRR